MEQTGIEKRFGDLAKEKDLITVDQLGRALRIQADEKNTGVAVRPLGRILLNEGFLSLSQIGEILKSMGKPLSQWNEAAKKDGVKYECRFGTIAIKKGFITKNELLEGLGSQIDMEINDLKPNFVGTILYSLGYMTLEQISEVVEAML